MQELMRKLAEAFGISGFEDEVRDLIRGEVSGLVHEISVDVLGNLIAHRKGTGGGRRIMFAAHMDQIGLMVTHVDETGFMRFAPVGFIYALASWGGQVRFRDGTIGTVGLDGRVNPRNKLPELRDMYIDVGAVGRHGVRQQLGDVAAFWPGFAANGDTWFSPNLDDRVGCLVLLELLRQLRDVEIAHDVYAVFTTQEEVGTRGAGTAAFALQPDLAIALDVTLTGDTPYAHTMDVSMGKGVAIKIRDAGMIGHPGLNRALIATAERAGIPYQREVLEGGTTDAYAIQVSRTGVPATAVSIPSRHVHTPSQIVDARDVAGAVQLLKDFLTRQIDL